MPLCVISFEKKIVLGPQPRAIVGWLIAKDLLEAKVKAYACKNTDLMTFFRALDRLPDPGQYQMPNGDILLVDETLAEGALN